MGPDGATVDLQQRFVLRPDLGGDSFMAKLERQMGIRPEGEVDELGVAPDTTIQLLAELTFVHVLVAMPSDIGGAAKRALLTPMLSWMAEPSRIPAEMDAALDGGLASTGVAFKTYRPMQLWLLIDFLAAWKALPAQQRDDMLDDPWSFKSFLWKIPLKASYAQREALLHLAHPDAFEIIVSRDHKRQIAAAFSDRVDGGTDDIDQKLLQIRQSLSDEVDGEDFDFYRSPIVEQWQPSSIEEGPATSSGGRQTWLLRSKVSGAERLDGWLSDGYCSIGWGEAGALAAGMSRETIRTRLEMAFPDDSAGRLTTSTGNIDRFLNGMRVGDLVVTPDGAEVYVGTITSAPTYFANDPESLRRDVEWINPGAPLARDQLSASAFSKLRAPRPSPQACTQAPTSGPTPPPAGWQQSPAPPDPPGARISVTTTTPLSTRPGMTTRRVTSHLPTL